MAGKVKTWVWVVIAVCVIGVLGLVATAAAGLWFFRSHVDIRSASPAAVSAEFDGIRKQFSTQRPLLELDERGHLLRANTDRPASTRRPESLIVMAFDPEDSHLFKMSIPFWMLRLKLRGGRLDVGGQQVDMDELGISVEDLERFGPTLILDHKSRKGSSVLVWSQ